MKRVMVICAAAGFLSACSTVPKEEVVVHQPVPVTIPSSLFDCPPVRKLPRISTLKDTDVADVAKKERLAHVQCRRSSLAIQDYNKKAAEVIKNPPLPPIH